MNESYEGSKQGAEIKKREGYYITNRVPEDVVSQSRLKGGTSFTTERINRSMIT